MMEEKINVTMDGKTYLDYLDRKKFKLNLSKGTKKALPYFIVSSLLSIIAIIFFENITAPPTTQAFNSWYSLMPLLISASWSTIGKVTVLYFMPFIIIVIGLSWLVHGVGFTIIKR